MAIRYILLDKTIFVYLRNPVRTMFDKLYPFPENLELQVQILSRCTYCNRTVRWVDNKKYIGTCKEDRIYNSSINIYLLFNDELSHGVSNVIQKGL